MDRLQNNGSVKAVSPRHCPATCALRNERLRANCLPWRHAVALGVLGAFYLFRLLAPQQHDVTVFQLSIVFVCLFFLRQYHEFRIDAALWASWGVQETRCKSRWTWKRSCWDLLKLSNSSINLSEWSIWTEAEMFLYTLSCEATDSHTHILTQSIMSSVFSLIIK